MLARRALPSTSSLSLSATTARTLRTQPQRSFQTSTIRRDGVIGSAPPKKPVGAFRGGLFGFLLGAVGAGAGTYYYILQEYRVSNELLTEDIFATARTIVVLKARETDAEKQILQDHANTSDEQKLQAAVQRIESYTRNLEAKVAGMEQKKLEK